MRKQKARKALAKKTRVPRSKERTSANRIKSRTNKPSPPLLTDRKLNFNHARIYVKDVERGSRFYRDLLGFKLIEDFRYDGQHHLIARRIPFFQHRHYGVTNACRKVTKVALQRLRLGSAKRVGVVRVIPDWRFLPCR